MTHWNEERGREKCIAYFNLTRVYPSYLAQPRSAKTSLVILNCSQPLPKVLGHSVPRPMVSFGPLFTMRDPEVGSDGP